MRRKSHVPFWRAVEGATSSLTLIHIIPKAEGGKDEYKNLQLLHRHCHHQKTAEDTKRQAQERLNKEERIFERRRGINRKSNPNEEIQYSQSEWERLQWD